MDARTVSAADQLAFLKTAAEKGVDDAIAKHGAILSAEEAHALKQLTPAELKSLHSINEKITGLRGSKNAGPGADWTCVNTVC